MCIRDRRNAAGNEVSRLWRTGLLPGASLCSGVLVATDTELRKLRAAAGAFVGVEGRGGVPYGPPCVLAWPMVRSHI
eukprot:3367154-Pyramimonas_sp.AAC.1